jgi:hypothetical protein
MIFKNLTDLFVFVNGMTREEANAQIKLYYAHDAAQEVETYKAH